MGRSIAKHAAEVIAGQGPLPIERLAEVLVGAGTTKARDPLKAVLNTVSFDRRFAVSGDGRVFLFVDQLNGALFTHRLTEFEIEHQLLVLDLADGLLKPPTP